jgi:hypothetical protein
MGGKFQIFEKNLKSLTFHSRKKVKRKLNSGNACYHSVQNISPPTLLPKNIKINVYWNIILPFVLCGAETWSLILKEKCRLRLFENRVLRKIVGPKEN